MSVTGTVIDIQDHGTIVTVLVQSEKPPQIHLVHFDHRPFSWLVDGRGGIENVINQPVVIDNLDGLEETVTFLDDIEKGHSDV